MRQATDWVAIEKFMLLGNTYKQTAEYFGVKESTIRKRCERYRWPIPSRIAKAMVELKQKPSENSQITATTVKNLQELGEEHAKRVFDLASGELAKVKRLPIRNWKDAEIADKTARRAAGMGNDDETSHISIIQLNEAMNAHSLGEDDVIEAELVQPGIPESGQPRSLEQGSPDAVNPSATDAERSND